MKKKSILFSLALLFGFGNAMADNKLSVGEVTLPKGGEVDIVIGYSLDTPCRDFQLEFNLPASDAIQYVGFTKLLTTNQSITTNAIAGGVSFVGATMEQPENNLISGTGNLMMITIKDVQGLAVGTTLTASLTNIEFSAPINETDVEPVNIADVNISIVIGEEENCLTLNENALVAPSTTTGNVDIKVKRTIKAGVWSTICLPFDMTKAQVEAAFGSGTKLAEFTDYSTTKEGSDVTGINVTFTEAEVEDGIYLCANYPYIIKATKNLTEFTVNAAIDEVELSDAESTTKRSKKPIGKFIGTYVAQTTVPANSLFLSDNQFCYSTGATKMKAFRGYFTFNDVLSSINSASARLRMSIKDGEDNTTTIEEVDFLPISTGRVYSVSGTYMGENVDKNQLPKGVYIISGKKQVVK